MNKNAPFQGAQLCHNHLVFGSIWLWLCGKGRLPRTSLPHHFVNCISLGETSKFTRAPHSPSVPTVCYVILICLTLLWLRLWRATTHTIILLHHHIKINQLPFQRDMSLLSDHIPLTNRNRIHYPARYHHK